MQAFEDFQSDDSVERQIAYEENGLINLERALLAKQDFVTEEERQQAFCQFYALATQLRVVHQHIRAGRQARLN